MSFEKNCTTGVARGSLLYLYLTTLYLSVASVENWTVVLYL